MAPFAKTLFADVDTAGDAEVRGQWFTIRVTPDIVTGETFNIGVAFIDSQRKVHARLLDSMQAFKCLYGNTGAGNLAFLIKTLRAYFEHSEGLVSPSPQISFSRPVFASGSSINEILTELYETMVPLGIKNDVVKDEEYGPEAIDTRKLRKQVFKTVREYNQEYFSRVFREEPVPLIDSSGQRHLLDLPIWADEDMFVDGRRYGTIVSAHFVSAVHRGFHLDRGALTLANAKLMVRKGRAGLFILRPDELTYGYEKGVLEEIDNDIDQAVFQFSREKNNATIVVNSDIHSISNAVLEFTSH